MENIFLPSKVEYQPDPENKNKGKIIVEPCYPGYGITLGNALRRVLLSSLSGAAVTAVKIRGVKYEFSTISGVLEDVLTIILNLKQLRLKILIDKTEPICLTLQVSGEKEIKARDIKPSSDVEVVNPDLHIATLTDKKAKLEMDIWVCKGYGWVPSEEKSREGLDIGTIVIDSAFSPIVKVAMNVENMRVGKRTDYDRLILDIETDGGITPIQAFSTTSQLLNEEFKFLVESTEKIAAQQELEFGGEEKRKKKTKKAKKTTKKAKKK